MKRSISLVILFVFAAGIVVLVAQAQAPRKHPSPAASSRPDALETVDYLQIGSARVWLGMTKAQVAEALKKYPVEKDSDDWRLDISGPQTIEPGQQPEIQLVLLQFTAGRLNYANLDWPVHENDVAGTVFELVSHWQYERMKPGMPPGMGNCILSADVPAQGTERVWVYCGQKALVIAKHTLTGGGTVQGISEVLGEHRE